MNRSENGNGLGSFSAMLREALGDLLDASAETFVEMLSDDAVIEFPYAPPGVTRLLEGREAAARHASGLQDLIKFEQMTDLVVHRTTQASVIILEFGCIGSGVQTGRPYNQTYISVITLRDGHIIHYRDYWNPLVVLDAMGNREASSATTRDGG